MPTIKSEGLMSKNPDLKQVLVNLVTEWTNLSEKNGYLTVEQDPDWPSPCVQEQNERLIWKPVLQSQHIESELSFDNVGEAFNITIDPQYSSLFTTYFSDNLNMGHVKGEFQMLQAWSLDDFERLQQNLVGHLLMKQKLKQTPTLFFGLTDQEDLNLVVNNDTGEVCLEYVGKEPHEVLAADLVSFLSECSVIK